jgi:hypothetical protein
MPPQSQLTRLDQRNDGSAASADGRETSGQGSQSLLHFRETGREIVDSRVNVRHGGQQRRHVGFELRKPGRLIAHLFRQEIQAVLMARGRFPRFVAEFAHLRSKLDQGLQGQIGHSNIVPSAISAGRRVTRAFRRIIAELAPLDDRREPLRPIAHQFNQQIQFVATLRERFPHFIAELAHLRAELDQRLQRQFSHSAIVLARLSATQARER